MELPWAHRRCIFCLRELSDAVPFSRAHLVSESVGGFAWAWTHCKECNEQTGADIEEGIVRDDSVRFAVDALADHVPEVAARFRQRMAYMTRGEQGVVRARRRGDEFEILTSKVGDVRTASTERARSDLEKRLRREKRSEEEIVAALELFDEAEIGVPVEIAGETIIQGVAESFLPEIAGEEVTDAFPALIAFHFLALSIGENIYDERLNPLREAIKRGEPRGDWHIAERGIERPYLPQHLVGFGQTAPHLVVRVQLFNWNVWRVHFPRLASKSKPHGYLFDLVGKRLQLAAPTLSSPITLPEF